MPQFTSLKPPPDNKITSQAGTLLVPDDPILPFIEGDGIGPDLWRAVRPVLDAALLRAYSGRKRITWFEVLAGEKAFNLTGTWLPPDTLTAFQEFRVGLKGPLTTPVGGGPRSLNVALRQNLDLYVCLRPVRYFQGCPAVVKHPERVDMVLFRENTEDIYAGIEWPAGSPSARKLIEFLQREMGVTEIRFPETSGIGIKPVSREGSERLVAAALRYALDQGRRSVTLVHKGNIMKFTEGAFRDWGYALAQREFRQETITERERRILSRHEQQPELSVPEQARVLEPGYPRMTAERQTLIHAEIERALKLTATHGGGRWDQKLLIKDRIADDVLQQVLINPGDFDVLAATNLNGDYLSDALAAQVGGIGIAPGGNINYRTGHAIFEATHGTAPALAGLDEANPSSLLLSGEMMFRHLGWCEAAELLLQGIQRTFRAGLVTADFARQMEGATPLKCSQFAQEVIRHMD